MVYAPFLCSHFAGLEPLYFFLQLKTVDSHSYAQYGFNE